MIKLIRRTWRYLVALLERRVEAHADPEVQLDQAITEAKERHERLRQHAASVIGHEKALRLRLDQAVEEAVQLEANAAKALDLAEDATDPADARSYEDSARMFATRLVAVEATAQDLRTSADQAVRASAQARDAVESNAFHLQKLIAEQRHLLSQLDRAKMTEQLNESLAAMSDLAPTGEVPTVAQIREKIQNRLARAEGEADLLHTSPGARMVEIERKTIDAQGAARLEAIRTRRLPPAPDHS